jgi:hypothetical protein
VGRGEITVIPHAITSSLCDDLLNKLDSLEPKQFESLATQPEKLRLPLRRLFQLGATGKLYHRCKQEGAKLLFMIGYIDWPVYKPTLIEALPGAKQGTFHRDFSVDGGLSVTFALTDKGRLGGDDGVDIAQPRRSGTVFDGNFCHASTAVATSAKRTVLLHLYAGRGLTARQLLDSFQCLARVSAPPESLQCYIMNQGGQLWMAEGWSGKVHDERARTCDLRSPDNRRFRSLDKVDAVLGLGCNLSLHPAQQLARRVAPRHTPRHTPPDNTGDVELGLRPNLSLHPPQQLARPIAPRHTPLADTGDDVQPDSRRLGKARARSGPRVRWSDQTAQRVSPRRLQHVESVAHA